MGLIVRGPREKPRRTSTVRVSTVAPTRTSPMGSPLESRYVAVFATSLLLALVLSPVASRVAVSLSVVGARIDGKRTPLLGGIAIYVACAAGILLFGGPARSQLAALLVIGLVIVAVGVIDDRQSIGIWKLLPELVIAVALVLSVSRLRITGNAVVDGAASVVFVVIVVNAVSHVDLANGLCAGLVAASCGGFVLVGLATDRYPVVVGAAAVGAACLGFLPMNYPTGRLFMGHAGNLFLGLAMAFFVLRLELGLEPFRVPILAPLLLIGVPVFDLALIVATRLLRSVDPQAATRSDHSLPRLVELGLSPGAATATLWAAQAGLVVVAMVITR